MIVGLPSLSLTSKYNWNLVHNIKYLWLTIVSNEISVYNTLIILIFLVLLNFSTTTKTSFSYNIDYTLYFNTVEASLTLNDLIIMKNGDSFIFIYLFAVSKFTVIKHWILLLFQNNITLR